LSAAYNVNLVEILYY